MRGLLIALLLGASVLPALADDAADAAAHDKVREELADAGAHAAICITRNWTLDQSVALALYATVHLKQAELDGVVKRMGEISDALRKQPTDVVCHDLETRYGPEGTAVKGLLVAE
ncbi:MAG: hypothetical protein WDM84_04920 [Bauldia sp.]